MFELSLSLAKVNFKMRNEGSYLGIVWYLLNPLAMFSILLFLGNLINVTRIKYYPVYLLLGIIMFNLFSQATVLACGVISKNGGFIKSMKIEYEPFVLALLLQFFFSHLFEVALLCCLMIYFHLSLVGLLAYPFLLFFLFLFIAGVSFLLATFGTFVADLQNAWQVLVNLVWFAAPVYYVVSKGKVPLINVINPMFYFIDNARDIIIYRVMPDVNNVLIMVVLSLAFLLLGLFVFEKYKHTFPEAV